MNQGIKDSWEKIQDTERGKVRPTISIISDTSYYGHCNDKSKFIEMICRCNPTTKQLPN